MAPPEGSVVTLLHFNDVYNIEPRDKDPVAGASRFVASLRSHDSEKPMVLFSGDAFNPSLSKFTASANGDNLWICLLLLLMCINYNFEVFDIFSLSLFSRSLFCCL